MKTLEHGETNMKTNMKSWVIPGVLSALLLTACGGGGGGSGSTDATSSVPSLTITAVEAVTAEVIVRAPTAAVDDVQVLVSTLKTLSALDATSEDADNTPVRDVLLYNSGEGVDSLPDIAANGSRTFSLKNINFAAASSNTATTAPDSEVASCSSNPTVLGTVRLEVFSQGSQLWQKDVNVCAMQAGYTVDL